MTRRGWHSVWWSLVLWIGVPAFAHAQATPDTTETRQVHILHADSLRGGTLQGERIRQLVGQVRLRQDSTLLRAATVIQYLDRDDIAFFGDVRIIDQGDTLRADTVYYDRRLKIGRATGRVQLSDGEVQVFAPAGDYFVEEKRAAFTQGVTLVDSVSTLTSETGIYWTDEERATFAGSVRLQQEQTTLEADSVTYFRETRLSEAQGNVFIDRRGGGEADADSTTRTLLFGDRARNDEDASQSLVEGNTLLVQLRADSTGAYADTLLVRARRLFATDTDSLQRLVAIDSVQIWQPDYAAVADSVTYDRHPATDSTDARVAMSLFRQPVAWLEQTQISGDTIRVWARDDDIDSLFVRAQAFVAQRDTLTDRLQQLKGERLHGTFGADSVRTFRVEPTAEAIYFLKDEDEQPDGGVRVSGDAVVFQVKGDTPRRIEVLGDPQGTYYDEGQLPSPFRLEGLRWVPERRPTKSDLLQRPEVQRRLAQLEPLLTQSPADPDSE